ncbi:MAG TPA: hypothetical protein VFS40_03605 [Gemmatimonadales bacterium]|nr:hypothetical protein [Gemmatimonadales bacterium]
MSQLIRLTHHIFGDHHATLMEAIAACPRDAEGEPVGRPRVQAVEGWTVLEYDLCDWWRDWTATEAPKLTVDELARMGIEARWLDGRG